MTMNDSHKNQEYTEVPTSTDDGNNGNTEKFLWKYFLRQLFLSSVVWTAYFACGICLGTPTIYINQMRREANSTDAVSVEMASWLSSVFSYASIPWCFILIILFERLGRKKTFIIIAFNQVLVSTSYYLSATPTHLLITEILHGMTHASSTNVCIIIITECTAPKNRGLMLTIKSATVYWGIWAANAIGTYASWRYIVIASFVCSSYSLLVFLWPESPTWLASQGKYEECRRAHRWLRGCDAKSEHELEMLITSHIEERKVVKKKTIGGAVKFFAEREFYFPMFLSILMVLLYQLSGKQVITIYAIDVIRQITSSEATAYKSMLILDAVSVFAMYIGCLISKFCKRRFMLFTFGWSAVFFLLAISLYLYLAHLSYFMENKYISVALLSGFSVTIGAGPIILSTTIYGEIIPLRYKGQATIILALTAVGFQGVLLKNSPYVFSYFDMHGTFCICAVCVSVCLLILYRYLPETKDKSLQEIEKYFKD